MVGDMGFSSIEEFQKQFPTQFINTGIQEQNMIGVAAGLALAGKKVFVYTLIPFLILRALEQIKMDICYPNHNVVLVGSGSDFSYGSQGTSHHAIEDVAALSGFPNLIISSPADPLETKLIVKKAYQSSNPYYIRLAKNKNPVVFTQEFIQAEYQEMITDYPQPYYVQTGEDFTIFTFGDMLPIAKKIHLPNKSFAIVQCPCFKPISSDLILKVASQTPAIFTLESHSLSGGGGSTIASILAENFSTICNRPNFTFKRFAIDDTMLPTNHGDRDYMYQQVGLTSEAISKKIEEIGI